MVAHRRSAVICLAGSLRAPAAAFSSVAGDPASGGARVAPLVAERVASGSDDLDRTRGFEQRGPDLLMRSLDRSRTTGSASRAMHRQEWRHLPRASLVTSVQSTRDRDWIEGAIIVDTLAAVPLLALWIVARRRQRSARPPTVVASRRRRPRRR